MGTRTTRALMAAWLWTCATAACSPAPEDLAIDSVAASKVPRQLATPVTVTGAGFTALVRVDLDSDDPPTIDGTMRVEIGSTAVAGDSVTLVDDHTLNVVVPAGLPAGVHDVRVIAPDGADATLVDGLMVVDAAIRIETAPGGDGTAVDGAVMSIGETLPLHAVTRFVDDSSYIRDEDATWTLTGVAGTIAPAAGTSTTFTAVADGVSVVTATSDVFGSDDSGDLVVVSSLPEMVPPLPSISVSPSIGDTATVFTADATGTSDYDEPAAALTYEWDWEADGTFDDTGMMATHTYPVAGDYRVVLRVTDSDGLSAFAGFLVVVTMPGGGIVVTTPMDEDDDGATPGNPGGTGLSLREALEYVDGAGGIQHLLVPSGYVINLSAPLPPLSNPAGIDVFGDGAVVDGGGGACFVVTSDDNRIAGFEIRNCTVAVDIQTGNVNRLSRATIHDNGIGVRVLDHDNTIGPNNDLYANTDAVDIAGQTIVTRNRIHDNTARAVFTRLGSDTSRITGNTMYRNDKAIELEVMTMDNVIAHNTMHGQAQPCFSTLAGSLDTDMRNNIFTGTEAAAIDAPNNQFRFRDYNLFFDNTGGPCGACSGTGANSVEADPLYVLPSADDYRLRVGSPAIDAGLDIGIDTNGDGAGDFDSTAPDIGAAESPF